MDNRMVAEENGTGGFLYHAYRRKGIGRRLLIAILLFSSSITFFITAFDLYLDYKSGRSEIEHRLEEIDHAYADALGKGLWNLDRQVLKLQLEGIAHLPGVRLVEISENSPTGRLPFVTATNEQWSGLAAAAMSRDIPLSRSYGGKKHMIGNLHIEASLDELYAELMQRAATILVGQAIKTFLVASFILLIVHRLITRHVLGIAREVESFPVGAAPLHLALGRKFGHSDEFNQVISAFNTLGERLARREAELWSAKNNMETILGNIPDLAWIKDAEGRYLAVNPPLTRMLGFSSPSEVVGKTDFEVNPPELAEIYRADDAKVMAARQPMRISEQHSRPDGSRYAVETIKTPLFDAAGKPAGTVGIARDVTEQKETESSLRETTARLEAMIETVNATAFRAAYGPDGGRRLVRTLVENTLDFIVRFDHEARHIYVPPSVSKAFGLTTEQMLDKTLAELTLPETAKQTQALTAGIFRAFAKGKPNTVEARRKTDADERIMDVRHIPEKDPSGKVISVLDIARDITALKAAETALAQSEIELQKTSNFFRTLLQTSSEGIVVEGRDNRMVFCNAAAQHILGHDQLEPLLREKAHWNADFVHLDRTPFPRHNHPAVATLRTGQPQRDIVMGIRRPSGERRWIKINSDVVKWAEGRPDEVMATFSDITAQVISRRALEESEAELRKTARNLETMIANLPGNVFRFRYHENNDKDVLFLDGAVARKMGRATPTHVTPSPEEFRQRFHPDDHTLLHVEVPRRLRESGESEHTFRSLKPDGGITWLRARERVIERDGNEFVTEGLTLDVSEEMLATQSLERNNRVLKTLSQGNEALVRAADETELFATMCRVIVETGGYRMAWVGMAENDLARTVRPVAHAGHEDGYLTLAEISWADDIRGQGPSGRAIRTNSPQTNDDTGSNPAMTPWRAAALKRGYHSSIALPLKSSDTVFGCLTIYSSEPSAFGADETALFTDLASDLSYGVVAMRERQRREEMERHLHETQKLEALGQLAGSVAHDFNNLLGAMLGFARFIMEDSQESDPTRHYAQRIIAAGQRGKALVGQILSFARRDEVKYEPVLLALLMEETHALLGASLPSTTKFRLEINVPNAVVNGDPDQLTQVMINLGINGHDALSGHPGTLTMALRPTAATGEAFNLLRRQGVTGGGAKAIETWTDEDGTAHAVCGIFDLAADHVSVVISDTGTGITAPLLERVFSPFFTTKSKGSGTGLGLAVVHGIVLAHGCALVVESRIGEGTDFELVLPITHDAVTETIEASTALCLPLDGKGKVLLVDDDPDFGDMLLSGLERRGYEVSPTNNPLEALAGVTEYPDTWDVMVTDYTMPDMTGLDLIKAIKILQPDLPCILCTGYAEDKLGTALLEKAGVFALLRKPVDMDALTDTVRRAMAGNAIREKEL